MGGRSSTFSTSEENIVEVNAYSSFEENVPEKQKQTGDNNQNNNSIEGQTNIVLPNTEGQTNIVLPSTEGQTNIVLPENYIEVTSITGRTTDNITNNDDKDISKSVVESADDNRSEIKTSPIRFWILGIFSFHALVQNVVWGPFGPIFASSKYAFGWEDNIIAIFQSLGPGGTLFFMIPVTWFDEKYGIRKGLLLTAFCILAGTGLRCISTTGTNYVILATVAGVLTGIAGCNCLAMPPMISALWFPPEERTTATAIGSFAAQIGLAGMYLSPLIVRSPSESIFNSTIGSDSSFDYNSTDDANFTIGNNTDFLSKEDIRGDIMELMYIEFGISLLLFLSILVYFPDRPKHAPSASSKIERVNYFSSMKETAKNRDYLLVLFIYAVSFGVPVNWTSVMNFSFQCININQNQTMWIGIAACLAQAVSAFITARITDVLYGYMKITIICLLVSSSFFFLWFVLLLTEVITPSLTQVFIALVGGYTLEYASVPLLIELGVELAYPCSESVVGSSFGGAFNFLSMLFLLFFTIPSQCYYWAGFVLLACISAPIIPLCYVKEKHKRSAVDRK